jgi:hypothetical protein
MTKITVNTSISTNNHVKNEYDVDNIFFTFPSKQLSKTFVNGTASERTIKAGTLVGYTTADQTIGKPVESDGTDGSEVPLAVVLYDIVIPAGAAEEVDALVGENGAIYEDQVVLDNGTDTLDTVMTGAGSIVLGQSVRNALLNANSRIKLEPAARNMSNYRNEQV